MSDDMISDFQIEASELLDEAEDNLLELDKGGAYSSCYNNIFRSFHSIKGAAGMFGIDDLQKHMHYLENLLSAKKNDETLTPITIDYFLTGVDCVRKILSKEAFEFEYHDPDASPASAKETSKTTQPQKVKPSLTKSKGIDTVWLVDDEEDILEILQSIIEEQNYDVKTFLSAKKLIENLKTETPDLIISDINMPEMNGVDLVHYVNGKRPHLPVIVLSGFVTKEVCLNVLSQGVTGIIEKPFDKETLMKQVALNVNRYQSLKLLNKSIDLLIYQFENFPAIDGKTEDFGAHFKSELRNILKQKNNLYTKLR